VARYRARTNLEDRGAVALTFDDGPDPDHTPVVLDTLRVLGVPATFFVVGERVRRHPDLVRRIVDEGHAVGSHSDSHRDPWSVPYRALARDYRRGRVTLEAVVGRRPIRLFRPPKGYVDEAGAIAMLLTRLRPWLWTVDPGDWTPGIGPDAIVTAVGPLRGGEVILLHDAIEGPLDHRALDRSATVAALPAVAERVRAAGLRFTTLR
jgi:peptidoglycan/xylan/chitin deacetylase (PgdA/CDA1 family)